MNAVVAQKRKLPPNVVKVMIATTGVTFAVLLLSYKLLL